MEFLGTPRAPGAETSSGNPRRPVAWPEREQRSLDRATSTATSPLRLRYLSRSLSLPSRPC
eukprot:8184446-Alexandrium_andersonii.AAC.1